MISKHQTSTNILLVCVLSASIFSCGGGAGGGSSGGENNNNTTSGENINGGLTGKIFANKKNRGVMVDIATGTIAQSPNFDWNETGDYSADALFSAIPNKAGTLLVVTINNCEFNTEDHARFRIKDCILTTDLNGNVLGRQTFYDGLWAGAKLSDDEQYIAYMYSDEPNYNTPKAELHLVDNNFQYITGTQIQHSHDYNSSSMWRGFDWTNNGEIVYGYDNSIYITATYGTEGSLIYTIPTTDNSDHFISSPKVSPDGTKIAFRYMIDSNYLIKQGNVWVMNIDGTDPHRLVYTPDYVEEDGSTVVANQIYNDHAWSPDGKYILVMAGGTSGDLVSGPDGASDTLYAIPSDSRDAPLNNNSEYGIVHIRSYFFDQDNISYIFEPYTGTITWVP
jgi:hypothetical protein